MTVLLFLGVLFVLILVHEWGHFIVAKKTGMRVDEFGIGFPPKLFGYRWRGTLYTLNLFPIGGFVRIYGENAEDAHMDAREGKTIQDSFTNKSKWAQSAVLIAGVSMNVLLAWALFVFVFATGVPTVIDEKEITPTAILVVQDVLPNSPAELAGIPKGATILSYGRMGEGTALTPASFKAVTTQKEAETVVVTFRAKGEEKTVEVTPQKGLVQDNQEQLAIGVALALVDTVSQPIGEALLDATYTTGTSLIAITKGLGTLFIDLARLDADLSQVAGPVGIVGLVGDAADFGLSSLLLFTAVISLNLAVINLLPFPALDGGRLLFVGIEAVTRKPINPAWVLRLNTFGFVLLIGLMIAVTYSDISKLI